MKLVKSGYMEVVAWAGIEVCSSGKFFGSPLSNCGGFGFVPVALLKSIILACRQIAVLPVTCHLDDY